MATAAAAVSATAAAAVSAAVAPAASGEGEFRGPEGDILAGLDGAPLSLCGLTAALRAAGELAEDLEVSGVAVVPGSELRWPQSHSAKLRLALKQQRGGGGGGGGGGAPGGEGHSTVFLKKVVAKGLPPKPLHALRRDLASNRNEARFYKEFAPVLAERGLPLLKALLVDEQIALEEEPPHRSAAERANGGGAPDSLVTAPKAASDSEEAALRSGGLLLLLESAEGYSQTSPLDARQAGESLRLLAALHAAAWQDAGLLATAARRLHRVGGYWTLEKRGEEELLRAGGHWREYVTNFSPLAPELFARPGVADLAARVERVAPWVARQLAPSPGDPFVTLVHGDYKAMNIFLREAEAEAEAEAVAEAPSGKRRRLAGRGAPALPIDFQWTGPGLGMSDVAMHLSHSVAVAALEGEGERRLVEAYRRALGEALGEARAAAYTAEVAWRHYCLGVVDYARMVLGSFFKGASQAAFASRSRHPNVGLAYRDARASLLFVERVDRCLAEVERWAP